jgi:hypothetical protein
MFHDNQYVHKTSFPIKNCSSWLSGSATRPRLDHVRLGSDLRVHPLMTTSGSVIADFQAGTIVLAT